ncbi:hypothetical protein AB0442_07115 [Kitasatospora sp. NPDC085895]|uniref:hypothetical protein n=1 Tax=Kitasatospora sp. NPDC085895 TaxID=3155057 RepID=UPI00344F2C58
MSGVGRVVRAGVRRLRVQTVVVLLATLIAVTASVLGGSLLVASDGPFERAFADRRGAHLTTDFDPARVDAAQLDATTRAPGATAAAGPFRTATVDPQAGPELGLPAGVSLPPLRVVGRADPGGPVDRLTLLGGHWPTGPEQVVLSVDRAGPVHDLGAVLHLPAAPGAAGMLAAIVFGTAATTFAVGIAATTTWVQQAKNHDRADVAVRLLPPPGAAARPAASAGPSATSSTGASADRAALAAAVERAIGGRAENGTSYGVAQAELTVPGVAGSTRVITFRGTPRRPATGWSPDGGSGGPARRSRHPPS